jgi:CheY-like chemotaxis protein
MAYADAQPPKTFARHLERVLVIEPNATSAQMLSHLLRTMGARDIFVEADDGHALATCQLLSPHIIFTELTGPSLNGLKFTQALRRSHLTCRKAPVIIVTAEATAAAIMAARNVGVHEFLRKPYTTRDLQRRIEAVASAPRDWIEAMGYVGPDRRRFNSGDYRGERKRETDAAAPTDADRITRALKILRAALAAMEIDPAQALRSAQTQAADLRVLALANGRLDLAGAAAHLQRHLATLSVQSGLDRAPIEAAASKLLSFMPAEADGKESAAA